MTKELLMGNQALALGAIKAGVKLISGYPGTPSTEALEYASYLGRKHNLSDLHVEWSTNEKVALEVAAGAAMSGARALATMKMVGLNVALDALMSLPYLGLGGLVLLVADDPGPFSSQTEQDTRQLAEFAKVPLLDPSTPEEALQMMMEAFEISEQYHTPVIVRPVTRVSHGAVTIDADFSYQVHPISGFDPKIDWVVLPARAYAGHLETVSRLNELEAYSSGSAFNYMEKTGLSPAPAHLGIVAGGLSWAYAKDAIDSLGYVGSLKLLKIGMPVAFPTSLAYLYLKDLSEVIVFEELEPVIERRLLEVAGRYHLPVKIYGHLTNTTRDAGESSAAEIAEQILDFLSVDSPKKTKVDTFYQDAPQIPARPPVLCAGCPHRASFYAVKQALKGKKASFSGDIGCYTLGNSVPLKMVQTCVCMGAGFTVTQGLAWAEPDSYHIGFLGDSTFFASGIPGLINAVYNQANVTFVVLDNSVTAMTGGQPHPGTGERMAVDADPANLEGNAGTSALSISQIISACGVECVIEADPLDLQESKRAVREAIAYEGVSAIVFRSPCIYVTTSPKSLTVNADTCINCKTCIRALGCPALLSSKTHTSIDPETCTACGLCSQICPTKSIGDFS
ncbi:MAG: indolepyruvate ferredoxin oxidoreductase subunit alpha [Coriobacteriia bacterium]|nr:indolepyruvate ferredoxin oxidoreductase subunit alpha [Coriobacteriia bacterium]